MNKFRTLYILILAILFLSTGVMLTLGQQALAQYYGYEVYLPIVMKRLAPTPTPTNTLPPTNTLTSTATNIPTHTLTPSPSTIAPSITPTNTATLTPTATLPACPNGNVYIKTNHSYFVDNIGYLHVVGEVKNCTSNYLTLVKITANFFNSANVLVDTDFTYTWLDNLRPGHTTCFHDLLQEPAGWAYYQFENPSYSTDGQSLPNLSVLNDSGSIDPTFGWYRVIGQVQNNEPNRVEYVSPVITLYNSGGTVLDCDFTYVNSTHLDPGQTSSFEDDFVSRDDYSNVSSYRIQVDGDIISLAHEGSPSTH
jgi:hypothetical protein